MTVFDINFSYAPHSEFHPRLLSDLSYIYMTQMTFLIPETCYLKLFLSHTYSVSLDDNYERVISPEGR